MVQKQKLTNLYAQHGLYNPQFEHDACGVGFVCNVKGNATNTIVLQSIEVLNRLAHRGAVGSDPETGDGAGILIQLPHDFFAKVTASCSFTLPALGQYGTGIIFLPTEDEERTFVKKCFREIIEEEGQTLLGWRDVPVENSCIGKGAQKSQPVIKQVFIQRNTANNAPLAFERTLYVIRRRVENAIAVSAITQKSHFYITNLSCRTFSYKGLLMPHQVANFYLDLKDPDITSALALVHSRYSTNTFPTWDLAQPFRFLAHNGEINTLRGNINWMRAKENLLASELFGKDIEKLKPIIVPNGSDSASIDNAFELLALSGRSLPHAMMMLIPSAWEQNTLMDENVRRFYQYHTCLMEPWDGPASIAFTDGTRIGAVLDRNGLRPSRYIVTKDDFVVMASEVGVLDIPAAKIASSGRLEPGKMFFIDTQEGRIIDDNEIKSTLAVQQPYSQWLKDNLIEIDGLPKVKEEKVESEPLQTRLKAFGYTREDLKTIIKPMAQDGKEPIGSMGNDTPHAILSKKPQLLYSYFKQLFAQVTNPAIDPIREELVMSLDCYMGGRKNLLIETPGHCRKVHLKQPILTNDELAKLQHIKTGDFKTKTISILFKAGDKDAFCATLARIVEEARQAIRDGYSFVVLSDRGVNKNYAAVPALLAIGAVHQYLVTSTARSQIALLLESAEPREVHHFAVLFAFGAGAINPYLAFETIDHLIETKELDREKKTAHKNYIKAVDKGLLKVLSKMGISTIQSYRAAQIFEVLGLERQIVETYFSNATSRIGGAELNTIVQETIQRHAQAYGAPLYQPPLLHIGGLYQWNKDGEFHLWHPETIALLQDATRKGDYSRYKEFAERINDQSQQPTTLRSLLRFNNTTPIPLDEVEPAQAIYKRLATGAMSFGSISRGTHETLALAMNRLGGKSNTGEGGEDPARFAPLPTGDSKRSAIKQVASGRFGVATNYLVNADELQIKIAQGAKPGEGGQLPGHKVSAVIARTRYTTPGVTLISPPPHHDIYSIEDLAQLIFDLKNVNPNARISVKLVSEIGVGTIAAGVAKGHADMILISGGDGGTGASPLSSIRHAGLPWELGLTETHQTLVLNDLRSRVRLQTDGQLRTGRDVAIAALLGAEEYGFCTAGLIVMGCIMLRHCHLNNCSVGVATQEELLEKRFQGRVEWVTNYFQFVVTELREIMASLGMRTINEMVGQTQFLHLATDQIPWKAKKIDYSRILYKPEVPSSIGIYCQKKQEHAIEDILDRQLIKEAQPALVKGQPVIINHEIKNVNRTTGAMLSGQVCTQYGESGLPEDTIQCTFRGVAGQSFGAWLARGVTFRLYGLANDYVGKGISGGKIIISPDETATYPPNENILIGNTAFYGAVGGEAYLKGVAGERFCIRNSGLHAVVEGVGDHGCEYMTGGRVVVIGRIGRNFAAGMSGGIAYLYDEDGICEQKINKEMVEFSPVNDDDRTTIYTLLTNHYKYTNSKKAKKLLDTFDDHLQKFIKILPLEYKRILEEKTVEKKLDLLEPSDG